MDKLDVLATARDGSGADLSGSAVVIIDVLRATTSMYYIFHAGGRAVYPVAEVEAAREKKKLMPEALLCGERGGVAPPGFDMGNSPEAFRDADLSGREIILTTTNGTQAVASARNADMIIAASFCNAASVAAYLHKKTKEMPVYLLCSGTAGAFSLEDFYCAGIVASHLLAFGHTALTDFAWAAVKLSTIPVDDVVNEVTCKHLGFLLRKGFAGDVKLSLSRGEDRDDLIVPVYDSGAGCFCPDNAG
ncbi:MAG: 2-phosphosulfolactate phosphatase [Spirochaetales bacterium]|nr:2-phosphosulfolactate phosphatase [Spirochaetales bacterium]